MNRYNIKYIIHISYMIICISVKQFYLFYNIYTLYNLNPSSSDGSSNISE